MNIQGLSPTITAPIMGQSASHIKGADSSSTGSASSTSGLSSSNLQDTFLNLLVTELQNQDPTSPVDPTEMVSQMVSLNQLDQLISINQTLSSMAGTSGSTSASGGSQACSATPQSATGPASSSSNNTLTPLVSQLAGTLAGAPNNAGLMNLYSSFGLPVTTTNLIHTGAR